MPSWIKEKDGIEWFDEAYSVKQTNQSPEQLAKKAKAGKIRRFKQRNGPYWYARADIEALRAAFLNRSAAAKGRKVSDAAIEARHSRKWERDLDRERERRRSRDGSCGPGWAGSIAHHQERAMLLEVEIANAKRKNGEKQNESE